MGNDVVRGKQRTYYSTRLILLCCAIAACVSGLVSVPVVLILSNDASNRSYQADVKSCLRQNIARRQTNARLVIQRRDAHNLGELASTMSKIRKSEARVFTSIATAFHIENQVIPLVNVLHQASILDKHIADEQSQVRYKNVAIQDCFDKEVIPKP